jgi:hypothetical protein
MYRGRIAGEVAPTISAADIGLLMAGSASEVHA